MSEHLDGRLAAAVARRPSALALQLPDRSLDYAALDGAVDGAVAWLAGHGVASGERVALLLPKGLSLVVLHLACLRRRAVSLPLNPRSSRREVAHVVADARPALLVGCDELLPLSDNGPAVRRLTVDPAQPPRGGPAVEPAGAAGAPDDLACLLYTSGTTGRPKGVMLSHGALAANDAALRAAWEWSAHDRLLHVLPLFHVHGLFVALHGALGSGAACRLEPAFDAAETWRLLSGWQATVFMGVPTIYQRLLAAVPDPAPALAAMRLFTCGSAPLRAETLRSFEQLTGQRILERYGMTEVGMACSNPYRGERRAGTVGFDLPGVESRLVDADDPERRRAVGPGQVGRVLIRSKACFSGYWQAPRATAACLGEDGWLDSGDLGRRDADGYLQLVGRAKELIISGGFNVYPQEVEACLLEHPAVAEAAVFGLPDDDLGETVAAAVVLRDDGATLPDTPADALAAELLQQCREHLAHYKCPRQVVPLAALPRNAMGKVQRSRLPAAAGLGD